LQRPAVQKFREALDDASVKAALAGLGFKI
jgi:hypothetical protein